MATLEISHRTVNFNHRILNLRTVTALGKLHGKTPRKVTFGSLFLTAIVFAIAVYVGFQPQYQIPGLCAAFVIGVFLAVNVRRFMRPRDFWVLHVETAAGSDNLLASRDEQAIDGAVRAIRTALESDVAYHTNYTISDSTIVSARDIKDSPISNTSGQK